MVEEWFVIPNTEKSKFRNWLTEHPGYKFRKTALDEDLYANSISTFYNANEGDVCCQLTAGQDDQQNNFLVTFSFKEGTLDEGLLGLIGQNFNVLSSSFY